jgi:two-component sensor histidine kinase
VGNDLHTAMGVMTLVFLTLVSFSAWRINLAVTERVTLKEHFAERVTEQTAELIRANDELRSEIADRQNAQEHLRESLKEKEVLLKEIHHRVKNNLAVIISLLKMRAVRMRDPAGKEALQDCYERVEAIALIHETLYQSEDLAAIPLGPYAENLAAKLMQVMLPKEDQGRIGVRIDAETVDLPIDAAVPCGLILNELFTNALKYAFPNGRSGQIRMSAHLNDDGFEMAFQDDGVGFPAGLDLRTCSTLGFRIISFLVQHQMEGNWEGGNEAGASIRIRWPMTTRETHDARISI